MLEKYKTLICDIELYKNLFMCTFLNENAKVYRRFIKYESDNPEDEVDEISLMFDYLERIDNLVLITFNGLKYDDIVLKHLYENSDIRISELWEWSQNLIKENNTTYEKRSNYKYKKNLFKSLDLFEITRKGFNMKGLKSIGVSLKHEKLQELPIEFDKLVEKEKIDFLYAYNKNDIVITRKLKEELKKEIELREFLCDYLKIDVLTESDTGIAKKYFQTKYIEKLSQLEKFVNYGYWDLYKEFKDLRTDRDEIEFKDIFFNHHSFLSETLQNFYRSLQEIVIVKNESKNDKNKFSFKWKTTITFCDKEYEIALGGIHSKDKPGIFVSDEEKMLLDLDVTSYYPMSIINNKICPEHLDVDIFIPVFLDIVNDRKKYKKLYKETKKEDYDKLQACLKISINSVYGLLNSEYYWFYDPLAAFQVTLNNQMYLLNLIERFNLQNFEVISVNTDGLLLYIDRKDLEKVREIYAEWEKEFNFELEETFYKKYIRKDVNNYIAIKENNEPKLKGGFNWQIDLLKGYEFPVCSKAIYDYFVYGKPVEESILQSKDIFDFCVSKKVKKTYEVYLRKIVSKTVRQNNRGHVYKTPKILIDKEVIEEHTQKINRWYATKGCSCGDKKIGWVLNKIKKDSNYESFSSFKDVFIQILNDYVELKRFEDYNIDYDFYINQCKKVIDKIEKNG